MAAAAAKKAVPGWKAELENRIPGKVIRSLERTFAKGSSLAFHQGRRLIEYTCNREKLQQDYKSQLRNSC